MRKIIAFLVVTADGYYEGPNQEFDWPIVDDEFNDYGLRQLDEADTLLFGRATYESMASYWPTPAAKDDDPEVAERMNSLPKVVVSRSLERAEWANTQVVKGDVAEEIGQLKQRPGKDILLLGSSDLTVSLMRLGLLDELRIMVNPIVLGDGKSVFRTAKDRIGLKLLEARTFDSGNVLLSYQPVAS
jgi:dihydrofolate reductase